MRVDSSSDRPAAGSSSSSSFGSVASAMATVSSLAMPSGNSAARSLRCASMPRSASTARARSVVRATSARYDAVLKMPPNSARRVWRWRPCATFSSTVMSGNSVTSWKVRATPRRASAWLDFPVTSAPASSTRPVLGGNTPAMMLNRVDLPAPLGPTNAVSSPSPTSNETSERAASPPKRMLMSRTASTALIAPPASRRRPWRARAGGAADRSSPRAEPGSRSSGWRRRPGSSSTPPKTAARPAR